MQTLAGHLQVTCILILRILQVCRSLNFSSGKPIIIFACVFRFALNEDFNDMVQGTGQTDERSKLLAPVSATLWEASSDDVRIMYDSHPKIMGAVVAGPTSNGIRYLKTKEKYKGPFTIKFKITSQGYYVGYTDDAETNNSWTWPYTHRRVRFLDRIGTAAARVKLEYSTDGSSWTEVDSSLAMWGDDFFGTSTYKNPGVLMETVYPVIQIYN